jgi:hypothetical protein
MRSQFLFYYVSLSAGSSNDERDRLQKLLLYLWGHSVKIEYLDESLQRCKQLMTSMTGYALNR